jgi:hypothetical protein
VHLGCWAHARGYLIEAEARSLDRRSSLSRPSITNRAKSPGAAEFMRKIPGVRRDVDQLRVFALLVPITADLSSAGISSSSWFIPIKYPSHP